jgi:hypothetical protein
MVATKISEIAGKGLGWATTPVPAPTPIPSPTTTPARPSTKTSSESYWDYANKSLAETAEQTYSTISSYLPTFTTHNVIENLPLQPPSTTKTKINRQKAFTSPLALFQNTYTGFRGGRHYQPHRHSSMEAVRSLLNVVPVVDMDDDASQASSEHGDSIVSDSHVSSRNVQTPSSSSETASQLAEGTIRAFRDLCLDEAVELHRALRYWSLRVDRPLLSWCKLSLCSDLETNMLVCRGSISNVCSLLTIHSQWKRDRRVRTCILLANHCPHKSGVIFCCL